MASGKRRPDESFQDYRERLKDEHRELRTYLNGRFVYTNLTFSRRNDGIYASLPFQLRPIVAYKNPPYRKEVAS